MLKTNNNNNNNNNSNNNNDSNNLKAYFEGAILSEFPEKHQ